MVLLLANESTNGTQMGKHQTPQHLSIKQGRYTVTMLDDVNTTTRRTFPRVWFHPQDKSQPSLVEGFHLPNRFRVDGLGVNVEMEVSEFRRDGLLFFGCTSLTVTPLDESAAVTDTGKIPVATLVKMAVKCARTLCMYYPAHYEGAVLDHKFRAVNGTLKVGDSPHVQPVSASPPRGKTWSDEAISSLMGKPPRRPNNAVSLDELQAVADVYNAAREAGVRPLLAVMNQLNYGKRTADNRVAACKKLKLIPAPRKKATR